MPRDILIGVITQDKSLIKDSKRLRSILLDLLKAEDKVYLNAIISAQTEGIVSQLASSSSNEQVDIIINKLSKRLHDNAGLREDMASWAVESWAKTLGVIFSPQLETVINNDNYSLLEQKIMKETFDVEEYIKNKVVNFLIVVGYSIGGCIFASVLILCDEMNLGIIEYIVGLMLSTLAYLFIDNIIYQKIEIGKHSGHIRNYSDSLQKIVNRKIDTLKILKKLLILYLFLSYISYLIWITINAYISYSAWKIING